MGIKKLGAAVLLCVAALSIRDGNIGRVAYAQLTSTDAPAPLVKDAGVALSGVVLPSRVSQSSGAADAVSPPARYTSVPVCEAGC
jgi:hypothetical protein